MKIQELKSNFPQVKEIFELLEEIYWHLDVDEKVEIEDREFNSATEAIEAILLLVKNEVAKTSTAS